MKDTTTDTFKNGIAKPMLGAVLITNSNKMNEKILERLRKEFAKPVLWDSSIFLWVGLNKLSK